MVLNVDENDVNNIEGMEFLKNGVINILNGIITEIEQQSRRISQIL